MLEKSSLMVTLCQQKDKHDNYAWGPGIHKTYVIHYIKKGRGYFEAGGKRYALQEGESFIIYPETKVRYYPDQDDPWVYTWVNFTGHEVASLIAMTGFSEYPVCPRSHKVGSVFELFSDDMRWNYTQIRNGGLLRVLFSYYIECYPSRKKENSVDYLYYAKQYIIANCYRQDFSVSELASSVGVERSYLYRLFKENTGMSTVEYIINTRMENALQILDSGTTQIKLVSYSVGYDNPLYFSNCFKKKYGLSPKNYLKSLNGVNSL